MKLSKDRNHSHSSPYTNILDQSRKQGQIQLEATLKYQKFKKSASLPNYFLNKNRLKKITQIYRALSSDKINLHTSKSRRNSPSQTPEKRSSHQPSPFSQVHFNSIMENSSKPKNKLIIQRGVQNSLQRPSGTQTGNSAWAQMTVKLRSIKDRLDQILNLKSQENFSNQLAKYLEGLNDQTDKRKDYTGRSEVLECLKSYEQCLDRRQSIKISDIRKSYSDISSQISDLQIELKKKNIRAILDQKQIQKYQANNKQLLKQIEQLKKQISKQAKNISCGTDEIIDQNFNSTQNIFLKTQILTPTAEDGFYAKKQGTFNLEIQRRNIKISQCMKKIQNYNRRQKELLSVLVILRGEGVDVEKIYDDIINGRIQIPQKQQASMLQSVNKLKQSEKKMYKKYKKLNNSISLDADNSNISSADGLSFSYDAEHPPEDIFPIKREYKCKKILDPQLKQKLKLNFDVLYDQQLYQDDYESDQQQSNEINPPTI